MAIGSATAWTFQATGNGNFVAKTIVTHASTATTATTAVMNFLKFKKTAKRNITIFVEATTITGPNIDVALWGSDTEAGTTKYLLLDAPVADLLTGIATPGIVDLNAYPAPYYFLVFTTEADESAVSHRSTVRIFIPAAQP